MKVGRISLDSQPRGRHPAGNRWGSEIPQGGVHIDQVIRHRRAVDRPRHANNRGYPAARSG